MEGATIAIVGFIFVCIIFPSLVKNRPQFYGALGLICFMILLDSFGRVSDRAALRAFVAVFDALMVVGALLLLVLSTGGLTPRQLAGDIAKTIEVVRRGGEKETIVVPLTGEQPKPRVHDLD